MKHTLVALVQDRPGVLNRAVSLFRRRGLNIESLTVSRTEREGVSKMTWVVESDNITPVIAQLEKLIEVLDVYEERHADAENDASTSTTSTTIATASFTDASARTSVPRSMFALSQADGIA